MPTGQQKIRIYDLAKELKLDNKKVMEDARREGIDCSVPSNTVPHEVADRIRLKYFPKKLAPQVGPRLVKHVKPVEPVEAPPPEPEPTPEFEAATDQKVQPSTAEPHRPKVRVLKATPQPQTSAPAQAAAELAESQAAEPEERDSGPALPDIAASRPPTQVRVLRPRPGASPHQAGR